MKTNWMIVTNPHDWEAADELYVLLQECGVREFLIGDTLRSVYNAMGLNTLKSAAWHNGHYVGGIKQVKDLLDVMAEAENQLDLPLDE